MKEKVTISTALLAALFLTLAPIAFASTTWYVNGVSRSDSNSCMSSATACKTIGHAISLAGWGDSIRIAAATYTENLTIGKSLNVIGAGATTTIIDGHRAGKVIDIPNYCLVTLSNLTIRNGFSGAGAGIYNYGFLTINNSTISGNTSFALYGSAGAGIYNSNAPYSNTIGSVRINNTTISGNSAACGRVGISCASQGGGISNVGGAVFI